GRRSTSSSGCWPSARPVRAPRPGGAADGGGERRAHRRGPRHHRRRLSVLLAVISDTHLPRGARVLPEACVERLRSADLVLHAGDPITPAGLGELGALGGP